MWTTILFAIIAVTSAAWVKEMENPNMFEGDIVLDPDERESTFGQINTYASIKGGRWPNAKVPYVITRSIGSNGRGVIQQAFEQYHKHTCLRFSPRTNEQSYISFHVGQGCSSPVGYRYGRRNDISLAGGCQYLGTTMHEIGHSIGLYHEQSRPDRDSNVRIIWKHIESNMRYNFNKFGTDTINSLGTPYDFRSMMHYGATAFGRGQRTIETINPANQRLIGQRGGFSDMDIVQINKMYCGGKGFTAEPPTKLPTQPPGGCVDFDGRCSGWSGYCTTNDPKYKLIMERKCCATCKGSVVPTAGPVTGGPTLPPDACENTDNRCSFWASNGYCAASNVVEDNFKQTMNNKCCKACLESAACRNRNDRCDEWANRGECSNNTQYMHSYCRKSCKRCS